tara:strand:- start:1677 stop:2051 length:375 start_codon:yes stop_codon:yes gene_type:complete
MDNQTVKKKLHHTKYKANYKRYILNRVNNDSYSLTTDKEKIEYIFNRFNSEYSWNIKRNGKYKAMTEWLSGLALDLPYMSYEIIELAKDMGSIDSNASDKVITRVLQNYWEFMSNIILSMEITK